MKKRPSRLALILLAGLGLCLPTAVHAGDIGATADRIEAEIAQDSGRPAADYSDYARRLAKTLTNLSPEVLDRVLREHAGVVTVQDPETLNEQLGLNPIAYGLNDIDLTPEGMAELDKVAEYLNLNPGAKILIEGHTQYDGGSISEDRANVAKAYLEQLGISPDRIEAVGLNNTDPLVQSGDHSATQINRRIEIHAID